jgi:hypothetical protein
LLRFSSEYVFIEFMPLGLWNGKSSPAVPDWYTMEWFTKNFEAFFELIEMTEIEQNRVLFIGRKKIEKGFHK